MNNNMGIYCIHNIKNGKRYIGQSTRLDKRYEEHFYMLKNKKHHSIKLQEAYTKETNKDIFQFEILEFVDNSYELDIKEQYYIDLYDSYYNGYNCISASNCIPKKKYSEDYLRFNYKNFIKINIDELMLQLKILSFTEKVFLFSILPYVDYDCSLKYKNERYMSIKNIIALTSIPKTTVYNSINSLIQKKIIYKIKNNNKTIIFINPWLFLKGNKLDEILKIIFANYKIKSLNKKWCSLK
jgi:group I intron endonuclease